MRCEGEWILGMIRNSSILHFVRPIHPIFCKCDLKHSKYGSSADGMMRMEKEGIVGRGNEERERNEKQRQRIRKRGRRK